MKLRHVTDCMFGASHTIESFVLVGAHRGNGVARATGKNLSDNPVVVSVSKTF